LAQKTLDMFSEIHTLCQNIYYKNPVLGPILHEVK